MQELLTAHRRRQLSKALLLLWLLGNSQAFGSLSSVSHGYIKFSSGKKGVYTRGNSPFTVIVFLDTECPISLKYTRRLTDLHTRYAPTGVRFISLYPSPTDKPGTIKRFRRIYKLPFAD